MTYEEKEWFEGFGLDDPHQRSYFRRLGAVITLALIVGLVLAPLIGCAKEVPECAFVDVNVMRTPTGALFVFDAEQMTKLVERTKAIQRGECRLPLGDDA